MRAVVPENPDLIDRMGVAHYLIGAALVGQLPAVGRSMTPEIWWALLPLLYLIHFFHGLAKGPRREAGSEAETDFVSWFACWRACSPRSRKCACPA
jgi:hypothetical protein